MARSLESMSSLAAPGNTPSLDEVRDRIERRYANAMGRAELAGNSVEGRMLEIQKSTLDMAGSSRLEQIRASMAGEQLGRRRSDRRAAGRCEPAAPAADPAGRRPARRDPGQHGPGAGHRRHHRRRLSGRAEEVTGGRRADAILPPAAAGCAGPPGGGACWPVGSAARRRC